MLFKGETYCERTGGTILTVIRLSVADSAVLLRETRLIATLVFDCPFLASAFSNETDDCARLMRTAAMKGLKGRVKSRRRRTQKRGRSTQLEST